MILNSHKGRYTSNTIRKQNTHYDDLKRFQKERKKVKNKVRDATHAHQNLDLPITYSVGLSFVKPSAEQYENYLQNN